MAATEKNQAKSKRGGARVGAGRKIGSCTTKTREIAEKAMAEGITPLEYMLQVLRDESQDQDKRMDAAKAAAPYVHPKLSAAELSGPDGSAIPVGLNVTFR